MPSPHIYRHNAKIWDIFFDDKCLSAWSLKYAIDNNDKVVEKYITDHIHKSFYTAGIGIWTDIVVGIQKYKKSYNLII